MSTAEYSDLVAKLSPAEKIRLIDALWDSMQPYAEPEEIQIPEWHRQVLDQREAEMRANPNAGIPFEESLERIRRGEVG